MPYLDPPPYPAPVIVQKDVGGYVADYRAATERYRAEDREVQLHECRSACTMALSLPGVCVFPTSLLKFHKAYDVNTRIADEGISQELFSAYPPAIQAKLGTLSRSYKVLTGAELIAMGVRNCAESRILVARRQQGEPQTRVASAAPVQSPPGRDAGIGAMFQSVLTAMAKPFEPGAGQQPTGTASPAAVALVPLPPRRPSGLGEVELAAYVPTEARVEASDPPRPKPVAAAPGLPSPGLPRLSAGAQPVLPSGSFSLAQWTGR